MFAFSTTFNPPPLRVEFFAPGGYHRNYFGPNLTDDEWTVLVCEDWTKRRVGLIGHSNQLGRGLWA